MPISFVVALALQAPASPSPVCEKLWRSFVENEVAYSNVDDFYRSLLPADRAYADATGVRSGIDDRYKTIADNSEKYQRQGDRIVTLLAGQGCPMPDHVTSPITYRKDIDGCSRAKGTPQEAFACGYIDRAVAEAIAGASKPTTLRRIRNRQ